MKKIKFAHWFEEKTHILSNCMKSITKFIKIAQINITNLDDRQLKNVSNLVSRSQNTNRQSIEGKNIDFIKGTREKTRILSNGREKKIRVLRESIVEKNLEFLKKSQKKIVNLTK